MSSSEEGEDEQEEQNAIRDDEEPGAHENYDNAACNANPFAFLNQKLEGDFANPITTPVVASVGQCLLNILNYCKHFKKNHTQTAALCKAFNAIFAEKVLPDTRYLLDQAFKHLSNAKFYFFCNKCAHGFGVLGDNVKVKLCRKCNTQNQIDDLNSATFFVMFCIKSQLEILLNTEDIADALNDPLSFQRDEECLSDLYDGIMYKAFVAFLKTLNSAVKVRDVSFTFDTDGSPLMISSKCTIWPIFLMVNELPPFLRMENLMIAGLWFGNKKPVMDLFLDTFVDQMKGLSTPFSVTVKGDEWFMRAHVIACCADAPARAAIQCVHQFNGEKGCGYCLSDGIELDDARKYPGAEGHVLRTAEELLADGKAVLQLPVSVSRQPHVNGVTGVTPLFRLDFFDPVKGMILDYPHNCCYGVARQMAGAWLGSDGAKQPYYIGSPANMEKLDKKLLYIKPPKETRHRTRPLSDWNYFSMRQWENFILFYSVPVLHGILPAKYLKHWMLFVQACHILLRSKIKRTLLQEAEKCLIEFVRGVEEYYSLKHMTYNVHILLHLVQNVRNWSAAWCLSTYPFESENGKLKRVIFSSMGIPHQVIRVICRDQALSILRARVSNEKTEKYEKDLTSKELLKCIYVQDMKCLGSKTKFTPTDQEFFLCERHGLDVSKTTEVQTLVIDHCSYSGFRGANCGKRSIKTDNSCAVLNNDSIVKISKIILQEETEEVFAFVSRLDCSPFIRLGCIQIPDVDVSLKTIDHESDEMMMIPVSCLKTICVRMDVENVGSFVSVLPSLFNTS